jgi:uncharacterized phage protein (TIGR02220 family)
MSLTKRQRGTLVTHIKKSIDKFTPEHKAVVKSMNRITGRSFRPTDSNLRLIKARMDEGYSAEDLAQVVRIKNSQWLNTDYEKYIRPITLFSPSKFQGYLEESRVSYKTKTREEHKNLW